YPALAYQLRRGLPLAPRFPALADYAARMAARPAAIRARPIGWDLPASRNLFEEARELRPHD
ncbi:MAG: glutathione S-transferase family protein, partial [Myxococcales bacterium]|nr:glutathione S-transferase family protein [Myxococcales bacterium]